MPSKLLFKEESYRIRGASFEVYKEKEKGCGFHESVYQECLELELGLQAIPFLPQPKFPLTDKGKPLAACYQPDLICFDKIIVGLKAVSKVIDDHRAQVINYLKATGLELTPLVNFGHYPKIETERFTASSNKFSPPSLLS